MSFLSGLLSSVLDSTLATVNASISSRSLVAVWKSGSYWVSKWPGGLVVSSKRLARPKAEGQLNWKIFTHNYSPKPGDVVVDLGAGIGTELIQFSKSVGPSGKVIAVDASAECCSLMTKLIKLAKLTNVEVVHCAVGSQIGQAHFPQTGSELTNRLDFDASRGATAMRMETVESLLKSRNITKANLIKMNIEGAEALVVQTLKSSLSENFVISCHDFMGIPELRTFEKVKNWASSNKRAVSFFESAEAGSCESYYVYC